MKKSKIKLNLINNYVQLYQIFYECNNTIKKSKDANLISRFENLKENIKKTKLEYENKFKDINIIDECFINLKKELNETLLNPPIKNSLSNINLLSNKLNIIKNELENCKI